MRYSRLAFICMFLLGACGDDDDDDDQFDTSVNDSSGGSDSAATFDSMPSNDAGPPDADPTPDAMPVETMGCVADPLVAPLMISWTGTVTTAQGMEPVADALVEVYNTADVLAGSDTSAADGTFSITITTGGLPFDGYAKVTHAEYVTNYIYPPDPVAMDIDAPA